MGARTVPWSAARHAAYLLAAASAATASSGVAYAGTVHAEPSGPGAVSSAVRPDRPRITAIVVRPPAACRAIASAIRASGSPRVGTCTTTTASQWPSAYTSVSCSSRRSRSPGPWPPPGRIARWSHTVRPAAPAASAVSAASAPEPASTATRRPVGRGWAASSWATSSSWCWLSTRTTPDWRSISSRARRGTRVRRTACPTGTTCPDRPAVTTTTGMLAASLRATRANLRGLPIDSRYSPATEVLASWRRNCITSLPETSARCPAETNVDRPRPRRRAEASSPTASGADWQNSATAPAVGGSPASDAFTVGASPAPRRQNP